MLPAFLSHIYIKAEPPAVPARGGEITHFIMSIIVKAALEFQEGFSGCLWLCSHKIMGLRMEPECIRNREAITGGHALSFPKGKWPEVCRDPTYCVSLLLPLAAHSFSAELCSSKTAPLNIGSFGMVPVSGAWLEQAVHNPPPAREVI